MSALDYVRRDLCVASNVPCIAIEDDGYVRAAMSAKLSDADLLVCGMMLALRNEEWKEKVIERARSHFDGIEDNIERVREIVVLSQRATTCSSRACSWLWFAFS